MLEKLLKNEQWVFETADSSYNMSHEASKWLGKRFVHRKLKSEPQLLNGNPVLTNFMDSVNLSNMGTIYTIESTLADSTGNVNLSTASMLNTSITPTNIIEENYRTVQEIYMFVIANNIDSLSETQKLTLQDVAWQCPFTGGNAVYGARVILSLIDTTLYVNNCEYDNKTGAKMMHQVTDISQEGFTGLSEKAEEFVVYPNPVVDELFIDYNISSDCRFEIYDILGKKLQTNILKSSENKFIVSMKSYNQGIYFYKLIRNNNLLKTDKITIIK